MALTVGIHESVVLGEKTALNDKGNLVISFATKVDNSDLLGALERGEDTSNDSANLIQFKFNTSINGTQQSSGDIGNAVTAFRKQLKDIMLVFMTEEVAEAKIHLANVCFAGLGVTTDNIVNKLLDHNFLDKVYDNMVAAFLNAVKPFINGPTFRVILVRSSKAKHYAKIPAKGKFPRVWIESTSVPKSASKIAFTDYEIAQGLNSGEPTPTEQVEATSAAAAAAQFAAPAAFATPAAGTAPAINPFQQR